MTTHNERDDVRLYFTDDEWNKMPDYMKQRYMNTKQNYDMMLTLGLHPPVPDFMKRKPEARKVPSKRNSHEPTARSPQPAATKRLSGQGTLSDTPAKSSAPRKTTVRKSQQCDSTPSSSSTLCRYTKRDRREVGGARADETSDDSDSSSSSHGSKPTDPKRKTRGRNPAFAVRRAVRPWCLRDQPGECPAHGPPGCDKHATISAESLERARESLPHGLVIFRSRLRGAQLGVFTLASLNEGVCFGPYKSSDVEVSNRNRRSLEVQRSKEELPAAESSLQRAIWVRYVNCALTEDGANLVPLSKDGAVYYSTCTAVGPVEELLVWCDGNPAVSGSATTVAEQRTSFACPVCARQFPKSSSVKKHMVAHTREKPYQCVECGERFGGAKTLKHHRRTHLSSLSYQCPTCGEGFGHLANLRNHLWVHRESKPYACAVCGREFSTLRYARRHEFREHGKL